SDKKTTELEALLQAHRAQAPADPALYLYEARLRLLQKKPMEAAALFQEACTKRAEDKDSLNLYPFLCDMADAGCAREAYRAASDKASAFVTLAQRLLHQKQEKELATLLVEYAPDHAKEARYLLYCGELHLLRKEIAEADRQFSAALAAASPQEKYWVR